MNKKIFGWILIILGIILIGYSLYSSFGIFTAQKEPPSLFNASQETETTNTTSESSNPSEVARQEMKRVIQEQLKTMFPKNSIIKILNLIAWSFWAGLLIFGGSKISSLGIKLLKK